MQRNIPPELQDKFFREARAAAQLRHPHIVSVHEVGRDGDTIFIVSDYIRGVSLADWLTGQQLTGREAAELAAQLAAAIHAAHEQGVVHRDLKPANILMDRDGVPHITDFGLARRDIGEVTVTVDGQVFGTPAYMSPEQATGQGHEADRRSDVYSLGVILFQLLTGELPFRGNPRMLLHQVIHDEAPSPRQFNANIGRDLETIVLRCLEKEPGKRFDTCAELAADLRRFLAKEPIRSRPVSRVERLWRWCGRHPQVAGMTALLAFVLAGATVVSAALASRAMRAERDVIAERDAATAAQAASAQLAEVRRIESYPRRIRQAWQSWQDGDLVLMRESLASLLPAEGESDLRGFEWHYLTRLAEPIFPPLRHETPVRSLAVAPDGKTAATAGLVAPTEEVLPEVWIWDVHRASVRRKINTDSSVHAVVFDSSGNTIVGVCNDGMVRMWNAADGTLVREFVGPGKPLGSIALSSDGKRLAVGVGRWTIRSGNPVERFLPPGSESPGSIAVYDPATGTQIARMAGHSQAVLALAFNRAGTALVSGGADGYLRIWDVDTGNETRAIADDHVVFSVAVSPTDQSIVSSGLNNEVRIRDFATGALVEILTGATAPVLSVAVSADGRQIVGGGGDRQVRRWQADGRTMGRNLGHALPVTALAADQHWTTLFAVGWDGVIHRWPANRPQEFETLTRADGRPVAGYSAAFSADSQKLAAATSEVVLFDVATRREINAFATDDIDVSVAFSPAGPHLAAAGYRGKLYRWLTDTGEALPVVAAHNTKIWGLAFAPDGQTLVTAAGTWNTPGEIGVWDAETGVAHAVYRPDAKTIRTLAVSADGRTAAFGMQGRIERRRLADGTQLPDWPGSYQVAISPDGRTAVFGDGESDVLGAGLIGMKLWDISSDELRANIHGHTQEIYAATFSADGRTMATAGWDGTVRLWHAATGHEMLTFRRPDSVVWSVAFSPNNHYLAVGGGAVTSDLTLWDARPLPNPRPPR